jgi:hypothetical protein
MYLDLQDAGRKTPLDNCPKWSLYAQWYIEAFAMLSSSRQVTMDGIGPIIFSEIIAYMNNLDIVGSKSEFIAVITSMDRVYIDHYQNKLRPKKKVKNV